MLHALIMPIEKLAQLRFLPAFLLAEKATVSEIARSMVSEIARSIRGVANSPYSIRCRGLEGNLNRRALCSAVAANRENGQSWALPIQNATPNR